jgi:hypothetical protein
MRRPTALACRLPNLEMKGEAMAAMQDIMQELCSTYSVGYDALQDALQDICIFKSKLGKNGI